MGGFFGVASKDDCVFDLFFGVDYHSHLGTRRGGMCLYSEKRKDSIVRFTASKTLLSELNSIKKFNRCTVLSASDVYQTLNPNLFWCVLITVLTLSQQFQK